MLGGFLCFLQLRVNAFLLADVRCKAHERDDPPVPFDGDPLHVVPDLGASQSAPEGFAGDGLTGPANGLDHATYVVVSLGAHEFVHLAPDHQIMIEVGQHAIRERDAIVVVDEHHVAHFAFDERTPLLLGVAHARFGGLLLGEIAGHGEPKGRAHPRHPRPIELDVHAGSVFFAIAPTRVHDDVALISITSVLAVALEEPRSILLEKELLGSHAQEFVLGIAVDLLGRLVASDDRARSFVDDAHGRWVGVEQESVFGFRLAHRIVDGVQSPIGVAQNADDGAQTDARDEEDRYLEAVHWPFDGQGTDRFEKEVGEDEEAEQARHQARTETSVPSGRENGGHERQHGEGPPLSTREEADCGSRSNGRDRRRIRPHFLRAAPALLAARCEVDVARRV